MMRIVIPVISLERGGGSRFLYEVGSGLSDYGHDVHFVVMDNRRVEYAVRARLSYVPHLVPEVMPAADLVLPNFYTTVFSSLSGRAMPVRLCLSYEPFFVNQSAEAAITYRIPMPIVTISQWLQGVLREQAGRRSMVVNPGLDHGVFHPVSTARQQTLVVCLGRNPAQGYGFKGLQQFIQAMALVRQSQPSVQVVVVSPDMARLSTPFPSRLVVAPGDRELAYLLNQATVFVFPSLFEGFGLPPLEAMACGAPVVTTACGGVSDYAVDEGNCLVVPPGGVREMAEAILRLLGDPPLRRRLSAAAVETALPWTWVRAVDQMECHLRHILDGHYPI